MMRIFKKKLCLIVIVFYSTFFFTIYMNSRGSQTVKYHHMYGDVQPSEEGSFQTVLSQATWLLRDTCSPAINIAFLKTHKCASSTIQNMLMRYGDKHNLTFVMPEKENFFSVFKPFQSTFAHKDVPFHTEKANIFAMHAVWNKKEVTKVLYPNPVSFAIVREPNEAFVSLYDYFTFETAYKLPLDKFVVLHGIEMYRKYGCLGYNVMACDMGARPGDYMNHTAIEKLTHQIDSDLDLVLVAERFEESLVLMKHLLCWSYEDVIAFNVNARYKKKDRLTPVVSEMLSDRLKPDYYIYKYFTDKFDLIVKAFGEERMTVEVQKLRDVTRTKLDECNIMKLKPEGADGAEKAGSSKVDLLSSSSSDPTCQAIIRPEHIFVHNLKLKQADMLKTQLKNSVGL